MERSDLIIDSDVIIDFLRRRSDVSLDALTRFRCHITAITLYEIQSAAIRSERQAKQFAQALQYTTILPFDAEAAIQAAELGRELRQQGQPIGLPDTLIAGICLSRDMPLLTRNVRHYQRISGLHVITPENLE